MHPSVRDKYWSISSDKRVEVHGIFDIEGVVSAIKETAEGFDYILSEKDRAQNNEGPNKELTTFFDGSRFIDDVYESFISFRVDFKGRDVEVIDNGVKKIKTKGSAKIVISYYLRKDWQEKLKKGSKIEKAFLNLYDHFHNEHDFLEAIVRGIIDVSEITKRFKIECGSKFV